MLGFENLVFSIFEFVHALLENSKFKSTVKKALPELIYYVILYMQITEEQVNETQVQHTFGKSALNVTPGTRQPCVPKNRHQHNNFLWCSRGAFVSVLPGPWVLGCHRLLY